MRLASSAGFALAVISPSRSHSLAWASRVHLAQLQTDVDMHIADVVNLILYEDLVDVLVDHSYAGTVVTSAARSVVRFTPAPRMGPA